MKIALLLFLLCASAALGESLTEEIQDRAAVERVYYQHRLGDKLPFETALPREELAELVRKDLRKESVLHEVYGVEITAVMVQAEVQHIDATTHAPDVLAELKAALGNDPARFARTVARPIVVERELRKRFENDDHLHSLQRREIEQIRNQLLAARSESTDKLISLLKANHASEVSEITWDLTPRPSAESESQDFQTNSAISQAQPRREHKIYFEDVQPELQKVLRAQLRHAGDVSAVIETPENFLLYVTEEKSDAVLRVAGLTLFKRSYEQWIEEAAKQSKKPTD